MMPENEWRMVRPTYHEDGTKTVLLSAVLNGVRAWCEKHWSKADAEGERRLVHERFWTSDPNRAHRTVEAAVAAAMEPIESNEP